MVPISEPASEQEFETVDVGGVLATKDLIAQALGILEADHSTNVKLPLQRKGNPLWQMDYHGIAKEYYGKHPKLPPVSAIRGRPGQECGPVTLDWQQRVAPDAADHRDLIEPAGIPSGMDAFKQGTTMRCTSNTSAFR
jgi:hypothetical protein